MTATVWLVTSGDYSDYSILHVCLDEALANEIVAAYEAAGGYRDFRVEAHGVTTAVPVRAERLHLETKSDGSSKEYKFVVWSNDSDSNVVVNGEWWSVSTFGTVHDRVRKIHADRLAQIKAEHEGIG